MNNMVDTAPSAENKAPNRSSRNVKKATYPTYFESFDYTQMLRDYPLGDAVFEQFEGMSKSTAE